MIKVSSADIPDVKLIEPDFFEDDRGFFYESFNQQDFNKALSKNINFVQDNHSKSSYGVLRGLHYQEYPYEQGKLVRVISGGVFDVAVDIRVGSITYGKWVGEYLSSDNKKQLWIPPGFAHGFVVLSNEAELCYKTTNFYNPKYEKCIIYNDGHLKIDWPKLDTEFIISNKDLIGEEFINEK
jgi:dTDP-4-dehydrorhamnose 3,5-epimerase